MDTNGNGVLDSDEILSTSYVCNGVDGVISLTIVSTEPAGTNCESGGLKIDSGVDANGDGTLDDSEISATAYVCNGIDGNNSLAKITNEAAGANCENGGLKIDTGVDSDSDGTLDDSEISATAYVCNGIDGNDGLIKTTHEPAGANCESGGIKIDSGVDTNGDGTLDDTEITATAYVCNGIDGNNGLTKITSEAAGTNCENGGLRIDTGIDSDSDGTLDDSEITATTYVCNGIDGNVSLVNITDEVAGANCENGGVRITSGVDEDGDGILDNEEIGVSRYVCSGIDGGFDETIILNLISNIGNNDPVPSVFAADIPFFDIRDYLKVDSVVFVVEDIRTSDYTFNDITGEGTFELYDMTNDQIIANSTISSDDTPENSFVASSNLISTIPQEQIKLGVQLTSGGSFNSRCGNVYLILFRSN